MAQNKQRGQLQEQVAAAALLAWLQDDVGASTEELQLQVDSKTYLCFTPPRIQRRRIDLFLPTQNWAVEVKSYRVAHNRMIRNQIAKDQWLIQQELVSAVLWLLPEGATAPTLRGLQTAGLFYLDLTAPHEKCSNYPTLEPSPDL